MEVWESEGCHRGVTGKFSGHLVLGKFEMGYIVP